MLDSSFICAGEGLHRAAARAAMDFRVFLALLFWSGGAAADRERYAELFVLFHDFFTGSFSFCSS
jgi:hypothetical protein